MRNPNKRTRQAAGARRLTLDAETPKSGGKGEFPDEPQNSPSDENYLRPPPRLLAFNGFSAFWVASSSILMWVAMLQMPMVQCFAGMG